MPEKVTVLLVSDGREPFEKLALVLYNQGVITCRAESSAEVPVLLEQPDPPQLIFTDTTLSDGTWVDVVGLAARHWVPVIVVSRLVDHELYVQSLEHGAFDFVVPPFISADLAHIVRCAAWYRTNRRASQAAAAA